MIPQPHIYKLTDTRNGKIYIGQHNGKARGYFTGGIIPKAIIKKHGKEVFKREIIVQGNFNQELLSQLEIHYIRLHNSCIKWSNKGYNIVEGGAGMSGFNHSKKTKDKISRKNKGKRHTEEYKESLRDGRRAGKNNPMYGVSLDGELNGMYGNNHTKASKKKISDKIKAHFSCNPPNFLGETHSLKTISILRERSIKQFSDPKARENLSKKMKERHRSGEINQWGENNHRYGKPSSQRKPVLQFTLDGIFVNKHPSATHADRDTKSNGVKHAAAGKYKSVNGFIWIYEESYSKEELSNRIDLYKKKKGYIVKPNI